MGEKLLCLKKSCFEQLLESQLETLLARGSPEWIVMRLKERWPRVLVKLRELFRGRHKKGNGGMIPALPVIPLNLLSPREQMAMVKGAFRNGEVDLNVSKLWDEPMLSHGLRFRTDVYYVLEVEDGGDTLRRSMSEAVGAISKRNRKPHITPEGIALAIHTDVLRSHAIDLAASRYGRVTERTGKEERVIALGHDVPVIWVREGQPLLIHDEYDRGPFPKRGVPSRSREIVE